MIPSLDSRQLSQAAVALKRLGVKDVALWTKISKCVHTFDARSISNFLHTLATHGYSDPRLVSQLCKDALKKCSDLDAQGIVKMLNGLATLGVHEAVLVSRLCQEALKESLYFNSQDSIVTMLNALAKLGVYESGLVSKLGKEALKLDSQGIFNTLNALTKFNLCEAGLVATLCNAIMDKRKGVPSQDIVKMLNALAKFKEYDADLVSRLCRHALSTKDFDSAGVDSTLRALKKFSVCDPRLVEKLEEAMAPSLCKEQRMKKEKRQKVKKDIPTLPTPKGRM